MKRSTHVIFAVLFSFLLLSVLFSDSFNNLLQQTIDWNYEHSKVHLLLPLGALKEHQITSNVTRSINLVSHSNGQKVPVKSLHSTTRKLRRYAISSSYWEQQTNAILNMFCLQRWANSIGLTVVEPFVCQSELKLPNEILYNYNTLTNVLRLRDYIDLDYWNAQTNRSGVPPLESWENFIHHSTRKIVMVIMSHFGDGGTYTNEEISGHPNCNKVMSLFYDKHSKLFHSLQFEVVRNVCFSFFEHIMDVDTFNTGLQIGNEEDITVWFTEWRGVENGRISFTGLGYNEYGRTQGGQEKLLAMIHSSSRLLNDSKRYVHQVLGVDFYQYDAVVIRVKPINGYTVEMNVQHYNNCAAELEQYEKQLNRKSIDSDSKIFLAIDMGRFGDMVRADHFDYDSQGNYTGNGIYLFKRFLNCIYGIKKSIDSYDNDFIRATNGVMDSGYVGAVQKTIAMNAKSVLVMGGHSTFQKIIMQSFEKRHMSSAVRTLCYAEHY